MKLFPVQQVVFKLIEGLPLDDTVKFPVRSFEPTPTTFTWTTEDFTEQSYVKKLQREGRCIVPEQFSDPEWRVRAPKRVCLVTGRRAGKNTLISELAAAELERRVVSHKGVNGVSLLTVTTCRSQAELILRDMFSMAVSKPGIQARLANETRSYCRFQTDDDIARTGTWVGSQRQASASVKLTARTSQAKGMRGSALAFFCMTEPDHMLANQADEVMSACFPSLQALAGTFLAVGTPGIKGWMRKLFGHPRDLSIRIPTWEMNPTIPSVCFEEAYAKDPATFWAEFGACWLEEVRGWVPIHPPRPIGVGVPMSTLNEIGQAHQVWQDKNFDDISLLTQGLALSEECGEVSRAILKAHLGIRAADRGNLADELADVILVASSLATRTGIDLDAAVASKAARRDLKDFRARPNSG